MTRDADVLAEIVAQPASDAPRLIWADLVGGERGELVMLQCVGGLDRDGRSVEDDQPLHDGTEITLGTVTLQFFQGDGAGQRATACALRVATHEPLSRLPRATPAGAAELRIAILSELERRHGSIAGDIAVRELGRRLRDPAVSSPSRGEFRVFPLDRAPALAEACSQPIDHEGLMLEIRIATKLSS